jgi:predicted RNA-binding protein with PUA domain
MAFTKFNDKVKGEILCMLKLNYPHKQIQKEMKKEGINISRVTISRIKNGKDVRPKLIPKEENTGNRKGHYLVMTKEKIKKLEKWSKVRIRRL